MTQYNTLTFCEKNHDVTGLYAVVLQRWIHQIVITTN